VSEPHVPVLHAALVAHAIPAPGDLFAVDATLGAGGHAAALLRAMGPAGRLLGVDRDPSALDAARERLAEFGDRVRLVHGNFAEIGEIVKTQGWGEADAVVYDFGVSSMHLDRPERGFSYNHDAPLDMRMDTTQEFSARDVVNTYSESELTRVIGGYGEERWASRIAKFIVAARNRTPIETTADLVEIIRAAIPSAARRVGPHPARRTFQALRIEVNDELDAIDSSLPQAVTELRPGGRLVALSYHSLEDRIVKRFMRGEASGEAPRLRLISRKAQFPSEEEVAANPRARSARLRAAERLAAPIDDQTPPGGAAA
jgi:16S rRNA (cytosine1402-N4)-methyltransferase